MNKDWVLNMDDNDNLQKLDELLLQFFEIYEILLKRRDELKIVMKNGFLAMSKARYTLGNKSVGELQYSQNMAASSTVIMEEDRSCSRGVGFKMATHDDSSERELESGKKARQSTSEGGLRHRNISKNSSNMTGEIDHGRETSREKKHVDPLNWFGILVPSSLKECQSEFKTACQLSCNIAQLEQELRNIINEFCKLKRRKP